MPAFRSRVIYTGNGTQQTFNYPFAYISKNFVKAYVNGVLRTITWDSASVVRISPAPAVGALVELRRETPSIDSLVDFTSGTLREGDLDLAATQPIHLIDEEYDNRLASGVAGPEPWGLPVPFASGIVASATPPRTAVTYLGETFVCAIDHTTTSTFVAGNWVKIASKGDPGDPGTGGSLTPISNSVLGNISSTPAVPSPVSLDVLAKRLSVPSATSSVFDVEAETMGPAVDRMAVIVSGATTTVNPLSFTILQLTSKRGADTIGAYQGVAGTLHEPLWGERIRVKARVVFPSGDGTIRALALYRNGAFIDQTSVASVAGVGMAVEIEAVVPINQWDSTFEGAWTAQAWHNATSALNVTGSLSMEVISRRALYANQPWGRTIQGFVYGAEVRNWEHILNNQFGGNYDTMVSTLASFSALNLGSVVPFGPGTDYPHPKTFAGSYQPTSPPFNVAGRGYVQFLKDLKAANRNLKIFIYTTPLLDYTTDPWNPTIGMPTAGNTWSPGSGGQRWANLRNTFNAMVAAGEGLVDGVFFDICAETNIDRAKLAEAVYIAKSEYKFSVAINILFASQANADFALQCPYLTSGDYLYLEGFVFDSYLGDTTAGSVAVAKAVSEQAGRGVGLWATVEETGDTTYAGMATGSPYTHWLAGYNQFFTYFRPRWILEHQRASYDYVGTPGNA